MLPATASPLTPAELLRLDDFLHSSACGPDAMGLSQAHGFLTALISGPERLGPDEWLRLIFDEPVFADGEQAQDVLGLALRLYRDIEVSLAEPGAFRPVVDFAPDAAGVLQVDASAWCRGYQAGMRLFQEQWALHDHTSLQTGLALIDTLARMAGPPSHQQLCLSVELPLAAEAIYRYWRSQEPVSP